MKLPQIEISIKYKGTKKSDIKSISNSSDIYEVLKLMFNQDTIEWTEEVVLMCLTRSNKVIGYYKVSSGGLSASIVDPKVIFTIALNCAGTCHLVLAHNHPSGALVPSTQDDDITQKIKQGAALLDMKLLDHLIVTKDGYYSYCDQDRM